MTEPSDIRAQLETYAHAVQELRTVAREARARVERAAVVVDEAQTFVRDRRRQAVRAAGKHRPRQAGADV